MDFSVIDFAEVTTLVGSIGTAVAAVVKAVQAGRKAESADARSIAIELQREQTKLERDREIETLKTKVAVLEELHKETKERLTEGTNQFKALDDKVDTTNNRLNTTNDLLNQIVGALKNSGLKFNEGKL